MPWCPECAAEYREGIETCAKCRLPLQPEPLPRSDATFDPARAVAARLISAGYGPVGEALRHAAAGWRVLRRHRALLLVPLLLAVVQGGERMAAHAAWLRASGETEQPVTANRLELSDVVEWLPVMLRARLLRPTAALAAQRFAAPIPWLDYQYAAAAIQLKAQRASQQDADSLLARAGPYLPFPLVLRVFGLTVSGFILGAFFGQARRAVERDTVSWPDFGRDGRRHWLRLFLLLSIIVLLRTGLWTCLQVLEHVRPDMSAAEHDLWFGLVEYGSLIGVLIVPFFLALAWCAIVTEDAGLWQALRRSVVTVGRFVAVGVCLLLLLSLARLLLLLPVEAADVLLEMRYRSYRWSSLLYLPLMLRPIISAVIGAWFCLVALHWYRGTRVKIAVRQAAPAPRPQDDLGR